MDAKLLELQVAEMMGDHAIASIETNDYYVCLCGWKDFFYMMDFHMTEVVTKFILELLAKETANGLSG